MSWGNPNIAFGPSPGRYAKNKRLATIRRLQEARLRKQQAEERRRMEQAVEELAGFPADE